MILYYIILYYTYIYIYVLLLLLLPLLITLALRNLCIFSLIQSLSTHVQFFFTPA